MKKIYFSLVLLLLLLIPTQSNSQAEAVEASCKTCFQAPFIVTGKPFRALLTGDEVAEFNVTLFKIVFLDLYFELMLHYFQVPHIA